MNFDREPMPPEDPGEVLDAVLGLICMVLWIGAIMILASVW